MGRDVGKNLYYFYRQVNYKEKNEEQNVDIFLNIAGTEAGTF